MTFFGNFYRSLFEPGKRGFARTLKDAQLRLNAVVAAGNDVDPGIIQHILAARDAQNQGKVNSATETSFYAAYAQLSEHAKRVPGLIRSVRDDLQDPFEAAIYDAEELMQFASNRAPTWKPISLNPS